MNGTDPSNTTVVIAGDIDFAETKKLVPKDILVKLNHQ